MEGKATAIIILNFNNAADTVNCIESVERFNTAPIKYIVVDNGSHKPSVANDLGKYLSEKFGDGFLSLAADGQRPTTLPKATFFVNKQNEGYAKGNNRGLELVENDDEVDFVMILNNDVLFIEDILPGLISKMESLNDCAIISPALYIKDMAGYDYTCARMAPTPWSLIKECLMLGLNINSYRDIIKRKYWLLVEKPELMDSGLLEIEMPSGSCMLIRKKLFKEIGYFDPKTFLYYEENILYSKIYSRGLKNYLVTTLKCIHLGASSTKKVASYFIQRCGLESRTYYLKAYCHLTFGQNLVYAVAKSLYSVRLYLTKMIKH